MASCKIPRGSFAFVVLFSFFIHVLYSECPNINRYRNPSLFLYACSYFSGLVCLLGFHNFDALYVFCRTRHEEVKVYRS